MTEGCSAYVAGMSLALLPVELLQQICQYVRDSDIAYHGDKRCQGTKEFRNLALSCRLLYKIALPFLYHSLNFGPQKMFFGLRSIIERPDLGPLIKNVTIHGDQTGKWELNLGKVYTLLRKPGLLPKSCTRHLHPNDREAITALLAEAFLLQLSHAERLWITSDDFPRDLVFFANKRWKPEIRASLPQLLPALRMLGVSTLAETHKLIQAAKELKASRETGRRLQEEGQTLQDHEGILQEDDLESEDSDSESMHSAEFDSLSEQSLDIISQVQYLMALSKPQELFIETDLLLPYSCSWLTLPSVATVTIRCEGMHFEDFNLFLRSCPAVRSLDFGGGIGAHVRLDVREVIIALQHRQHELESLAISIHLDEDDEIMDCDTIMDMRHFSRLTTLTLDGNSLFDLPQDIGILPFEDARVGFIDKIPRSLETLEIWFAYEKHLDEMKALARRKARDLPKLKNLTLDCWKGGSQDQLEELRDELSKAGIKLVLTESI